MNSRDFVYWLQGFFEIAEEGSEVFLNTKQIEMIKRHLALVFVHEIDPSFGDEKKQQVLNDIHSPKKIGGVDAQGNIFRC